MLAKSAVLLVLCQLICPSVHSQAIPALPEQDRWWHGVRRAIRYAPDGEDFVISNGSRRFNRALYGTNTGFRIEAGDLPEFALYLPGMGGNLKFGLIRAGSGKWLTEADHITARYRPGAMLYDIRDALLGDGRLLLDVLAMPDAEGVLIRAVFENVTDELTLLWCFGGASGKRFNRDGDIGADPESCFYLKPEYCGDNVFALRENGFALQFGSGKVLSEAERYEIQHLPTGQPPGAPGDKQKRLLGITPPGTVLKLADARQQADPLRFFSSDGSAAPAVAAKIGIHTGQPVYYLSVYNPESRTALPYDSLPAMFEAAEKARRDLVRRVQLDTPDPYVNPIGGALAVAADAIYEYPSFLHGAVAWRMRLNGWRGAYAADPLGWHGRARAHFNAYALSQLTGPVSGPVTPDTVLHFARQKEALGTALFSSGYICRNPGGDLRAHHYDMNLVFVDQLLRHFRWTGDLEYLRNMWPLLERHLAWEKRCFDADNDGLYDAYCAIWASDALEYSGGGVAYASAYNYLANKSAAQLAPLIGQDPAPYRREADHILRQMNTHLWLPSEGWFAEYIDALGNRLQHPAAGLWTVYHAIDSEAADPFQAYQALRYIDTQIPHIPIRADGVPDGLYTLSTTNWMPYTWSVNNVALAEVLHTALAYWQGGRKEAAFLLWKSALMESMYLGASPGSFQQLSFYDAFRGELYRDFADPVGIAARTLAEGLFGIKPDAFNRTLVIQPGLPDAWEHAALRLPDVSFRFERTGETDRYTIDVTQPRDWKLQFRVKARADTVKSIRVNGAAVPWRNMETSVGYPVLEITVDASPAYAIEITWAGNKPEVPKTPAYISRDALLDLKLAQAELLDVYDPQQVLNGVAKTGKTLTAKLIGQAGDRTVFVQLRQGDLTWWAPLDLALRNPVVVLPDAHQADTGLAFRIQNNTDSILQCSILATPDGPVLEHGVAVGPGGLSGKILVQSPDFVCGSNRIYVNWGDGRSDSGTVVNWRIPQPDQSAWEPVPLQDFFNDRVVNIFRHRYESPRSPFPTVQIPLQGVGNWCYPLVEPNIDDSGLRNQAGPSGIFTLPPGIPFASPGPGDRPNVVFTSLWDNFPEEITIPLAGKARHLYLLMTGSTNPMQSRLDNGIIKIRYVDGSIAELPLRNPDTWWPIEQDYYTDGFAFSIAQPAPPRVHLKTGVIPETFTAYTSIKGYSDRVIDGGAATVLDLPLDPAKTLKSLTLKTLANEVVIGLMSATLLR